MSLEYARDIIMYCGWQKNRKPCKKNLGTENFSCTGNILSFLLKWPVALFTKIRNYSPNFFT